MIATVTLNPAVDKTYTVTRLIPGQVNRMKSSVNIAGGKGINVTKILRQYDYPVMALGFLGGYAGRFIADYVDSIHAKCRFTEVRDETRSSINILAEDGYVTEILEPGPEIDIPELEAFYQAYEEAIGKCEAIVLSGSAPKGVPTDIYATLIERAESLGKRVILDTSGDYLVEGIKAKPYMVKPNLKELEYLVGHKIKNNAEVAEAARGLVEKGIANVLVSMGNKGLIYADKEAVLYAKAPKVKVVNTVGCGDSAVAAFCMAMLEEDDRYKIMRKALAISAANATTLESAVIPKEYAEELMEQVMISEL